MSATPHGRNDAIYWLTPKGERATTGALYRVKIMFFARCFHGILRVGRSFVGRAVGAPVMPWTAYTQPRVGCSNPSSDLSHGSDGWDNF
jgi:hypothetical protein